jgi:hypothetical protein
MASDVRGTWCRSMTHMAVAPVVESKARSCRWLLPGVSNPPRERSMVICGVERRDGQMTCAKIAFIVAGIVASLFYAWYAVTILVFNGRLVTPCSERQLPPESRHHWSWWVHQIWFNFGGSALGWAAAYYLIFCRRRIESLADVFILLVAMVGVFGILPWRLFNTAIK